MSSGADQLTFTPLPDTVADTAPGAAGTVFRFVVSPSMAWARALRRAVSVSSPAASSASAAFAAVRAVVNAFHEASV